MSYEIFLPLSHALSLVTIKSLVLMTYRLNDIFCVCFQTNITEVKKWQRWKQQKLERPRRSMHSRLNKNHNMNMVTIKIDTVKSLIQAETLKSSAPRSNEAWYCGHDDGHCNRTYIITNSRKSHFLQIPKSWNTKAQPTKHL